MAMTVREAGPADLEGLAAIEWSGDRMFRKLGIRFPPGPCTVTEAIEHGADILVAGDPPAGFTELPAAQWGPQLRAEWEAEIDAGLHELGPRLVMVYPG
jgi:hypothetical protein